MDQVLAVSDTPLLRWLHLTDLHVGHSDESQRTAIRSLLKAIEEASDGKPFDVVFLTGDLAYSGTKDEYTTLEAQLLTPLRAHPLFSGARFISTPGNHDMDCSVGWPPVWKELGRPRQDRFFHLDDSGRKTRESRAAAFEQYTGFTKRTAIETVDPLSVPATRIDVAGRARPIVILSVVTAYFADKDVPDNQRTTPAPLHPIRTLLLDLPENAQVLILGHHPVDWFTPETEDQLHSLLVEKNALYLHGHEHKVKSRMGQRGLVALGFGAAYVAPLDGRTGTKYRNSFTICELTESLHVQVFSWDQDNGKWRNDQKLPGDFIDKSERLPEGYRLDLPTTRLLGRPTLARAIRNDIHVDRCIWYANSDGRRWANFLSTIGILRNVDEVFALPNQSLPAGHTQFRIKDDSNDYLVYAVSAEGDVLTYDQLQAINTELDRQSFSGCIVVTLGTLAADAKTLATQLKKNKPLNTYERLDVVRRAIRNLPAGLGRALAQSDPETTSALLLVTDEGVALQFQDQIGNSWFQVVGPNGDVLPESAELVIRLRRDQLALRSIRYEAGGVSQGLLRLEVSEQQKQFDRGQYLQRSYEYFDNVKYAPLAALGLRFRNTSLSEIYVNASADVGGTSKASQNLTRAVSEFVGSLNLPQAQRDQLESQLRSRFGLNRTAEVGAARTLYQRYNNIVVLGDPGSGKTCFVQHEILAYCQPPLEDVSWYANHLPIYVSLAEAARLLDGKTPILAICEIVSSRRGIELPKAVVEKALSEGKAAFFFDGLDEVGYIDKRIALLSEIDQLVRTFAARGNRFVLASRPAAVQPVDIPEAMTYLQLKGLTEDEIRVLASRVLTVRIGENEAKVLTPDEEELIDRLLDDTRTSPGIARIARNPLLLTLLVLIYANTGALSARRHVIYTQAIKTLVSVRGRQTREQQISEADLRSRLGALALAIFQRDIAEIPKRAEVLEVLKPHMRPGSANGATQLNSIADSFVQEVAEATGLLTIHPQNEVRADDLITFMHFSFLEYYAAAGLLSKDYRKILPPHSGNVRWKDVTTLLFGILSEQGDVTPLLSSILDDHSAPESISRYKTLLALDCAIECDVPPESAQDLLADSLFEVLSRGAGRYSLDLRVAIAKRLDHFLTVAGTRLEAMLAKGLRHENPLAAAAFADLLARLSETVQIPPSIVEAFSDCLKHEHAVTRAACLYAIEVRPELRSDKARDTVESSLKGSVIEKHAAIKVLAAVPVYQQSSLSKLIDLLNDPNNLISNAAAQCVLVGTLRAQETPSQTPLLERILSKLNLNAQETGLTLKNVTLDEEAVGRLIESSDPTVREAAIRSLPLLKSNDQFVYQSLQHVWRGSKSARHVAASFDALRGNPGAKDLLTIADTDEICSRLQTSERNVRVAAIRLLGTLPDDEQVVLSLRRHLDIAETTSGPEDEVIETAKALAKHVRRNKRLKDDILASILERLPKNTETGFGKDSDQQQIVALLTVCESIGGVVDDGMSRKLFGLADGFKTPLQIRRQATRAFGSTAEPSEQNVERLLNLLAKDDPRLNEAVFAATSLFVGQCRKKVEHVRRVYKMLDPLRTKLSELWNREIQKGIESIDPSGLLDIRDAVVEIGELTLAYEEFSGRTKSSS